MRIGGIDMSQFQDGKADQIRTRKVIFCPECIYYYAPVCTFYKCLPMTSRNGYCYHAIRGQYKGPAPIVQNGGQKDEND